MNSSKFYHKMILNSTVNRKLFKKIYCEETLTPLTIIIPLVIMQMK